MKDEIHNINLRSEDVQEILGEAPAWLIRYGNLIILLVILMIFLFSFLIKSPDEIEASGYLTTIEPLEKIYAPRTEKIDFLNFTDGEYINKGETIAILKNSANYKDIDKSRNIMGMAGNGGQSILIDFDRGRIIVINSIHSNYNWKKIAHAVIKN